MGGIFKQRKRIRHVVMNGQGYITVVETVGVV